MRERTTWNRSEIQRTAAMGKQADPYLMNQDHVSQNPRADKYMNGTPSSWAEDVHSPNEWEKEYAGGTTKRNETGEPEFRPETFNHQEYAKSASENGLLVKKADLCVKVARKMLPKAAETIVEDQAVALMSLPDSDLIETFQRLAQDDQGQSQEQAAPQQQQATTQTTAQDQVQQGEPAQGQPQQQQAQMQDQSQMQQQMQAMVQQMVQEAMKQQQSSQADFPGGEWGKNNPVASAKKAQDQGQDQSQGQAAPQQQQATTQQQAQMQDQSAMQQMVQQAVQQEMQAWKQQQAQGQQQEPAQGQPQQQQANDDQLLDQMLAPQASVQEPAVGDIELEPSPMDVGEVSLTAEDDVLKTLFATQESQQQEQVEEQQHQASTRSPSTRTVGTRPTAGVSRVGGSSAGTTKTAGDVDKLASLWSSAPDVREHFGLK